MRQGFEQAITSSNALIQKQVAELDRQIQNELTRAIERMGSHLALLSNKFVADYSLLTEKLQRVVEVAGRH